MFHGSKSPCLRHDVHLDRQARPRPHKDKAQRKPENQVGARSNSNPTKGLPATEPRGSQSRVSRASSKISLRRLWLALNDDCRLLIEERGSLIPCTMVRELSRLIFTEDGGPSDLFPLYAESCASLDSMLVRKDEHCRYWRQEVNKMTASQTLLGTYLKRVGVAINEAYRRLHLRFVKGELISPDDARAMREVRAIRMLRTLLLWWKRMPLCIPPLEESLEAYKRTERRIAKINYTLKGYSIEANRSIPGREGLVRLLEEIRSVLKEWYPQTGPDLAYGASLPGKVPQGATAEYRRLEQKEKHEEVARVDIPYRSLLPSSWGLFFAEPSLVLSEEDKRSYLHPVPKGFGKVRLICPEPTICQFYQHALAEILRGPFKQGGAAHDTGDYQDQTGNRLLALHASSNFSHCTADISEASDSIAWSLVKEVFPPYIVRLMSVVRTKDVRVPKEKFGKSEVLHLAKAFTSGAACCFLTEQSLYAATAEATIRLELHAPSPKGVTTFRVVGDDSVVPEGISGAYLRNLRALGMRVNSDKTFAGNTRFRESCGIEAMYGADITPLRFPREFDGTLPSPPRKQHKDCLSEMRFFESTRQLCNNLFKANFRATRRYLVKSLVEAGWSRYMMFSHEEDTCVRLKNGEERLIKTFLAEVFDNHHLCKNKSKDQPIHVIDSNTKKTIRVFKASSSIEESELAQPVLYEKWLTNRKISAPPSKFWVPVSFDGVMSYKLKPVSTLEGISRILVINEESLRPPSEIRLGVPVAHFRTYSL